MDIYIYFTPPFNKGVKRVSKTVTNKNSFNKKQNGDCKI